MRYDPESKSQMDFNGHKLYNMLPPTMLLKPSNVLFFEIINLSSKDATHDEVVAWGALPIVNGEFEVNQGKFKIPMLVGSPDFSANKFKDIESKYRRNVDEWLCNLYVEVKKVELFDFRMHAEKIEFTVPKKYKQLIDKQNRRNQEIRDRTGANSNASNPDYSTSADSKEEKNMSDTDDYSDSEKSDDDDGFETVEFNKLGVD